MTSQLKAHLEKHPEITQIHFDDEGHYVFHKRDKYPHTKSRAEVLAAETDPELEQDAKTEPTADDAKPNSDELDKTVAELIAVEGERDELKKENAALKAENAKLSKQLAELHKKAAAEPKPKAEVKKADDKREEVKTDNQQ